MRFEDTICFKCLGCNQLELKDFKGVKQCKNFVESFSGMNKGQKAKRLHIANFTSAI